MSQAVPKILLVESDDRIAARIEALLGGIGAPPLHLIRSATLAEGLGRLAREGVDWVLLGLRLSDASGFEVFLNTLAQQPKANVVALVSEADTDLAERVIRAGAQDALLIERLDSWTQTQRLYCLLGAGASCAERAEADTLRLAAFPRENPNPVLECDAQGAPLYLNPASQAVLQGHGVDLLDFLPPNHPDIVRACLVEQTPTADIETTVGGRVFTWTYQPVPALGVVHLYALDVTDRKRAQQRLQQNAVRDVLTGLPNRALLMDRLERNVDLLKRHGDYHFAVLLLDLDRFKLVNESLGHDGGDSLLREVTKRLVGCVKQSDTLARLGGDEFVILLEDIGSPGNVTRIADRIHKELSLPFRVLDREVFISASMGITLGELGDGDPRTLLQEAETAMYRSKSAGKGRYTVFDERQHARGVELFQLETDLRQGLARGELVAYYQPIASIQSRAIVGFEALARWQHPQRGLLLPVAFIELAEETGLVEALTDRVLQTACLQSLDWQRAGFPRLRVSVNLSALQFRREDLTERILSILEQTGLDPRLLTLEVTERVAAGDVEHTIATMNRLRQRGIGVAIDDFGTGYSSLGYLKRLPVDAIKIDRTFLVDVTTNSQSAAIATTIIVMAHALGFEVVAEGVEDPEQLAFLSARGCEYAQGFLLGHPMSSERFAQVLQQGLLFEPGGRSKT